MEFIVRAPANQPETVEVRYNCDCGCKPRARYRRGASEAGHEHCCCGRVHFVGQKAKEQLESYLAQRKAAGEDAGVVYSLREETLTAPWGEKVTVAYALPDKPQAQ